MIKLTDTLFVDAIPSNFTLVRVTKKTDKETGEEYEDRDVLGYYQSITAAIKRAVRDEMINMVHSTDMTLKEAIERSEAITERLEALAKGA